jgi:NADPH2:quinone reductase
MRAVTVRAFGPIETVRVEEMPEPQPRPGEVLIGVKAADTNYPDILVIEGATSSSRPCPSRLARQPRAASWRSGRR